MKSISRNKYFVTGSIIALIVVLCVIVTIQTHDESELMEDERLTTKMTVLNGFMYFTNNSFRLELDDEGKAVVLLSVAGLKAINYPVITIEKISISPLVEMSLSWSDSRGIYSKVLYSSGAVSINDLSAHENWKGWVRNLRLVFKIRSEIGLNIDNRPQIDFRDWYLGQSSWKNTINTMTSSWFEFNPYSFKSINVLNSKSGSEIWFSLTLILGLWCIFCLILAFIFKPQIRWLMTMMSMAWLLAFIPYGFNYYKQYVWLDKIYPDGKASNIINMADDVLSDVSQQIYTLIVSEESFVKNSKVYIYSPDKFSKLRLNYHLKNLNSAVLSYMNSEDLTSSRAQPNYLLLYDDENTACQKEFIETHQLDMFRAVYSTDNYCLIEIL